MQLGNLIEHLQSEDSGADALEALGDIVLYAKVTEMARSFDESPGEYVAASVARFAARADDESWMGLISAMEREPDPGTAALVRMLNWALSTDAIELASFNTEASAVPDNGASAGGCGSQCRCHDQP